MLSMTGSSRIFLCQQATDLRKGFEGLSAILEGSFSVDLTSGAYFVFVNRRKDRMKILYWDGDGLAIWYKRLEKGTFSPKSKVDPALTRREFFMLLEGIEPKRLKCRYKTS
jgi:transposase